MQAVAPSFPPPPPLSRHPVDIGLRTEAIIAEALVRRGYTVLQPLGVNQRYDLVVDLGGTFVRIQCKTGRLVKGAIRFRVESIRSNTRGAIRRGYAGEVDFFGVWCEAVGRAYLVPMADCPIGEGCLRVEPPRNGQGRRVRWARDYEIVSSPA